MPRYIRYHINKCYLNIEGNRLLIRPGNKKYAN